MRPLLPVLALTLAAVASAATVDGIRIHSTVRGNGPNTIVFVHGWTCDESSWGQQVPFFEKNYRVITLDLPGHGKSGSPANGPLTMDLFARAIEAVRVEAKAGKIVLVGHSMGTPVIRQYARLYPGNVAAMVPVDGALHLSGSPNAPNPDRVKGQDGLKYREAMIRGMFGKSATPALQDHILKMMLSAPETTAYQAMAATFAAPNWTVETFAVPALGIYADHSAADDPGYFRKLFPSGTTVEVPGTGHFVMMEKPMEFNKLLADFLPKAAFQEGAGIRPRIPYSRDAP
ncbi:MAG: alpha/beta hydrolase [Bryobacteraceae bacterium]|jgi:pimeloyl-ACP methyl ester carboxylesterase